MKFVFVREYFACFKSLLHVDHKCGGRAWIAYDNSVFCASQIRLAKHSDN